MRFRAENFRWLSTPMRLSLVLSVCLALGSSSVASAQDPREQARQLFQDGVAQFDAGEFQSALRAFEEAYRIAPHPSVRINIANCLEQLGRYSEALASYRTFLEETQGTLKPAERAEIERAVERLQSRFGILDVELSPADAQLTVDGDVPTRSPTGQIAVTPGNHVVRAALDGYDPAQQVVNVTGGSTQSVQLTLERSEPLPTPVASAAVELDTDRAPAQPEPEQPKSSLRPWVWISAGATVALAGGFAATAVMTMGAQNDFDDNAALSRNQPIGSQQRAAAYNQALDDADRAEKLALVSDVLLGGAVVAAGTTVVLWLVDRKRADRTVALSPMLHPQRAGLSLEGRF